MQTLADGLNTILENYRQKMIELEKGYLDAPDNTLTYIQREISNWHPIFDFLRRFIDEIKAQRFHGCGILQYLQKFEYYGNPQIVLAMKTMRRKVHAVFIQQLSEWLIYGQLVDTYGEFFIRRVEPKRMGRDEHGTPSITEKSSASNRTNTIADMSSANSELWQYEICYDMLPLNFGPSWAEKVLFIGQTVVMLSSEPRQKTRRTAIWREDETETSIGSLWHNQEQRYFEKLEALYSDDALDVIAYDTIINEIKNYVTERLFGIAFEQADLIKHLKLVKEFYLLGRGELFLEFIKQTQSINSDVIDQKVARDVVRAFQAAANRTNNDLDQISMNLPLEDIDVATLIDDSHIFLQLVELQFNVKWPLHLFFSPLNLKRYNDLFRFLLQIRKLQNDLHMVWAFHREKKMAKHNQLTQMRSKLMFFVDNLQYYLQVDVLESQFSVLMNCVQNSKDFEYIQRAHSVFQANIMSLCFLLNTATTESTTTAPSLNRTSVPSGSKDSTEDQENPVLTILHKIMKCICTFCTLSLACAEPMTAEEKKQLEFNDQMYVFYVQLVFHKSKQSSNE